MWLDYLFWVELSESEGGGWSWLFVKLIFGSHYDQFHYFQVFFYVLVFHSRYSTRCIQYIYAAATFISYGDHLCRSDQVPFSGESKTLGIAKPLCSTQSFPFSKPFHYAGINNFQQFHFSYCVNSYRNISKLELAFQRFPFYLQYRIT